MSHDDQISNKSANRPFAERLETHISRRKVLAGGLGLAAGGKKRPNGKKSLMDFTPVSVAEGTGPWPTISDDYQFEVLIPWGEPLKPGGPAFSYPPTPADQAKQIGIGHDNMTFFPVRQGKFARGGNTHAVLAINHEFGRNNHVLDKSAPESLEDVRVSQHAHGVSVVELKKNKGKWNTVNSSHARRIHVNTPVTFSGPAAGHTLLQTANGNTPRGTVNNCSNGYTPWGTYLTCEENFNGYFGATNNENTWVASEAQQRYGFSESGFGYGWEKFDRRFDLSDLDYANEENRFGWVIEIDPFDAMQTPVKRTALGRIKHEGKRLR